MRARLLLPLAAALAILPLLLHGPSCGHDFDFHLLNWLEAAHQLSRGHYPRWAYIPAWNAGEPRFLFYPPLSWLIGAALTVVLPFRFTAAAYTFLCLTLSGFTFHRLARLWTSESAATLAAVFYLLNPYSLFTAYERTAYAELLAAALIPILFASILRSRPTIPGIALPVALLWLTNAPAAVMSTYALALLALVRLVVPTRLPHLSNLGGALPRENLYAPFIAPQSQAISGSGPNSFDPRVPRLSPLRGGFQPHDTGAPFSAPLSQAMSGSEPPLSRITLARTTLLGTILGLALPAFYLLPAAYERRWVEISMVITDGLRPADNFLFHHTPDQAHDAVLHTASLIAVLLLVLAVAALMTFFVRRRIHAPWLLPCLATLSIVVAFLLTPWSAPVWNHAPELAFLQFPWRTCALLACAVALAAALAVPTLALRPVTLSLAAAGLAVLLIFHPSPHPDSSIAWPERLTTPAFTQGCEPDESPLGRQQLTPALANTGPTDEYTPEGADNDALKAGDPPFWTEPLSADPDQAAPFGLSPGGAPDSLTVNLAQPGRVILNRRQYPAWQIELNGHPVEPAEPERQDGLITVAVPAGQSALTLTFRQTRDRLVGDLVSLVALAVLCLILYRKRQQGSC